MSYFLPTEVLDNQSLAKKLNFKQTDKIFKKSGVRKRHIAAPTETSTDLAYQAAQKLFKEHKINKNSIDYLLFCTQSPDYKAPASACILQNRLGLKSSIGALDINLGCTGFVYGLSLAKGLIASNQAAHILLITAETPSKVIHPKDEELKAIFGDGAAATLIAEDGIALIDNFIFGTDGSGAKNLSVERSGSKDPVDIDWLQAYVNEGGLPIGRMQMDGIEIFIFSTKVVPKMINKLLAIHQLTMNDIDLFIFHQANGFLLEQLRKKLHISTEKFFVYLEGVGNTVSSSIPIAIKEAMNAKRIKKGDTVLLASFGIGYSWAGTIIKF